MVYLFVLCALLLLLWLWKAGTSLSHFPPGPFSWPVVGNLYQVLLLRRLYGFHHLTWAALVRRYGPVVGLRLGQVRAVLVACPRLVREACASPDFQGRPDGFFYRLRSKGIRGGLVFSEGEVWEEQKRFCMRVLRGFGLGQSSMESLITAEAEVLMTIIDSAQGEVFLMDRLFDISVLNILWSMMAGRQYPHGHEQLTRICNAINESFRLSDMSGGLLNQLPLLRYIAPSFCGFTQISRNLQDMTDFLTETIDDHRKTKKPEGRDLIDAILLEMDNGNELTKFTEKDLFVICLDFLQAGTDTTSNTLAFFILYMMFNPDVQKNIQKEIDSVVGNKRKPTLNDRSRMPYTIAAIQEVQRLANIAPSGVAHRTVRDTSLGGYRIPKDTTVLMLLYNVHTCKDWGDPSCFRPERFLDDKGRLIKIPTFMPFGTGRRKCVGEGLAKANIFIFITYFFQVYDVSIPPGESETPFGINDGVTLCPKPYNAIWTKRPINEIPPAATECS